MAFHLLASGKANTDVNALHKSLREGRIYVGKREKPVAVIKRSEIPSFMTDRFYAFYDAWSYFNNGFGLPLGGAWSDYPEFFTSGMRLLEGEFRTWQ